MVQAKLKKTEQIRTVIDENLPLRGILKCHCGNHLTGAPSKSKSGKYFIITSSKGPKHNNISAIKPHDQFLQVCELMSIPQNRLLEIRKGSNESLEENLKAIKQKILEKKSVMEETQEKMFSVEEKWIKNEISKDTYERWYSNYSSTILS